MKSTGEIFKNKPYCKSRQRPNFWNIVRNQDLEREQMEHDRFGYEAPQYREAVSSLKKYILGRCRDEKIWL